MVRTVQRLRDIEIAWFRVVGSSILPDARAHCVAQALEWGADKVVFIDDDISWQPMDFRFLVAHPVTICCGAYLVRPTNLDDYAVKRKLAIQVLEKRASDENGLVEIDGGGFGFIRINRRVFEEVDVGPLQFPGENSLNPYLRDWFAYRKTDKDVRIGEDFSFCYAAREAGHPIWLDPAIRLGHHAGALVFETPNMTVENAD
jgi:glycosyltransferase involved in cell wall biosynthesis